MADAKTVLAPGQYVRLHALAYSDADNTAVPVSITQALPVKLMPPADVAPPLAGETSDSGVLGPFLPVPGMPIWLSLFGDWTGRVTVSRSTDGGETRLPLTLAGEAWPRFTGVAHEPVGEESLAGAQWFLDVTIASGTLRYEVRQ